MVDVLDHPPGDDVREPLEVEDVSRGLIDLARNLERGNEPYCATNADAYRLRALDVVTPDGDLAPVLERYKDEITVTL